MRISLSSIPVANQEHALTFYAEVLGFEKKLDIPAGDHRWLTLVSPQEPDGTQLVLEPNIHPASQAYQTALFADGIPITAFRVENLKSEFERLSALDVNFTAPPSDIGDAFIAVFDDTCGNLIQLYEEK